MNYLFLSDFEKVDFKDLDIVATLGVGGFGRVELVTANGKVFALKCMKKCHILQTQQQTHVFNERDIMLAMRSPFICRLKKFFIKML
jgi:cGMP-dependent protein kinase